MKFEDRIYRMNRKIRFIAEVQMNCRCFLLLSGINSVIMILWVYYR